MKYPSSRDKPLRYDVFRDFGRIPGGRLSWESLENAVRSIAGMDKLYSTIGRIAIL
jgi:hypothetical protein